MIRRVVVLLAGLAVLLGCGGGGAVKIGAVLPLSGEWSIYGQPIKNGIDLAFQKLNEAGDFSGLSIFLWDNIALELGLEYSIEEYGLDEMLESIAQGKADVGVSCLSKTHEREKIIDFSHSLNT